MPCIFTDETWNEKSNSARSPSWILLSKLHPRSVLEEPAEPCHILSNCNPNYLLLTKKSVTHSGQEPLLCSGSPSSHQSASSKSVVSLTGLVSRPLLCAGSAICMLSCPSIARRSTAFPEGAGPCIRWRGSPGPECWRWRLRRARCAHCQSWRGREGRGVRARRVSREDTEIGGLEGGMREGFLEEIGYVVFEVVEGVSGQ